MKARRQIIPVFVPHLGCPHMCVFCNQRRISGAAEPATAETVRNTLTESLLKIPAEEKAALAFYGGSFTAIPVREQEELLGAAEPYLKNGRLSGIRLSTRPDCVDEDTVLRLKRYGVKTVELGVQSMSEEVLLASNRGHTAKDARKASKLLKDAGFELILQMMTGLPGDTPERSKYTASELIKLRPHGVRIYPTVIIKDTELYDMWKAGTYKEHTVRDAVELAADVCDMFDEAGITVVRLGLNPTEELSSGVAAAGAYHPALGELVEGRRYLKKELALISEEDRGREVTFGVAKGCVSKAVGQKRCNINAVLEKFGLKNVKIKECDGVKAGEVLRL